MSTWYLPESCEKPSLAPYYFRINPAVPILVWRAWLAVLASLSTTSLQCLELRPEGGPSTTNSHLSLWNACSPPGWSVGTCTQQALRELCAVNEWIAPLKHTGTLHIRSAESCQLVGFIRGSLRGPCGARPTGSRGSCCLLQLTIPMQQLGPRFQKQPNYQTKLPNQENTRVAQAKRSHWVTGCGSSEVVISVRRQTGCSVNPGSTGSSCVIIMCHSTSPAFGFVTCKMGLIRVLGPQRYREAHTSYVPEVCSTGPGKWQLLP